MQNRLKFIKGQQRKFLKNFLKSNGLSGSSGAKFLGVGKTTFKQWIRERHTLPENVFFAICEKTPALKICKDKVVRKLPENWGQVKGGKSRIQKTQNLYKYLERVRSIKNKKRLIEAASFKKGVVVNNYALNKILKSNVNPYFILATCLLTDGSLTTDGNNYRICYYTKDVALRKFMKALLLKLSKFVPSETPTKEGVYAIRVSDNYLAKKLLKLSPSYKKNPQNGESKEKYLSKPQPSLKFLERAEKETAKWCIRFAFSADGSISISRSNTIELNLACYHPTLSLEWIKILKRYGIIGYLGKEKTSWSGIDGVRIYDVNSLKNFAELGGFIQKVRITNKSKRYKGLEKNTLLKKAIRARSFPAH